MEFGLQRNSVVTEFSRNAFSGVPLRGYLELQRWWRRTGADIVTIETPEQRILELEHRYAIVLPDDFRQYLRWSSPVGEAMDAELGTWWGFDRIKNIPDEYPHALSPPFEPQAKKYLFFADHCIWCWAWAISCADGESRGKVALIGGHPQDRFVAESFSDFVRMYVRDWRSVC